MEIRSLTVLVISLNAVTCYFNSPQEQNANYSRDGDCDEHNGNLVIRIADWNLKSDCRLNRSTGNGQRRTEREREGGISR